MIQERALLYAAELGHKGFSGSNGWLDRWKKHQMATLCGEAADMSESVVDDWGKRLESICKGYELRNISTRMKLVSYNYTERCLQNQCAKGGKKFLKTEFAYLASCSAEGEKLTPFVICHSANPRCFKDLASPACLLVTYSFNKKAWMTAELFQ